MVTESEKSKHDMLRAMRKHIRENGITDFTDFQDWCDENNDCWSLALDSGLSMGNLYTDNLIGTVIGLSVADDWEGARREWEIVGCRLLRNTSTGAFIREEAKPVAGFISEEGYGR